MIITEKQFYTEELDYSIPEMQKVKELYLSGDTKGAEHAFAEYFKSALNPELYFGSDTKIVGSADPAVIEKADKICRGLVTSCKYTYDFGGDIDWSVNGAPDGYREWIWQFNRHGVFKDVARAYLACGDEKYAEWFQRNITS